MGRKAAAPGTPMPPEGPGPLSAGLGSIPGPAGGGGAPRAAATAPPPGLSGGNGNPPAPRPDIALSRPAVQRSGLPALCGVRSASYVPRSGTSRSYCRVPGFSLPSSQVLRRPALGPAAPPTPLLSGRVQIQEALQARRPLPASGGLTAGVQLPGGGYELPAPPNPGCCRPRPSRQPNRDYLFKSRPSRDPPQTGAAHN